MNDSVENIFDASPMKSRKDSTADESDSSNNTPKKRPQSPAPYALHISSETNGNDNGKAGMFLTSKSILCVQKISNHYHHLPISSFHPNNSCF